MCKYIIAFLVLILAASACGSDPIKEKKNSVTEEKTEVNSVAKPPGIVGCWQLSKFAYDVDDLDDESKWLTQKDGALMVLRGDGRFMKWFGDYGDNGSFELRNDSLFLNRKNGDGSTAYRLDSLTPFEMILTNKDEFVPILKYRRLSQEAYDIWKTKFK